MTDEEIKDLLEANYKYLPEKLMKIHESVKKSLELSDFSIRERALAASAIHHGYLTTFYAENAALKKIENLLKAKEKEYRDQYGKRDIPRLHVNDEMKSNETIIKLNNAIEDQMLIVSYLKDVLDIFKTFGYNIKNAVQLLDLEKR